MLATLDRMSEKQPKRRSTGKTGGDHVTPRLPIQVPEDWKRTLDALAKQAKQPSTWYLQALIAEAADKAGIPRPLLRWEKGEDLAEPGRRTGKLSP